MSAIAGVFRRDGGPVERDTMVAMTACMARRGPDGAGVWCAGAAGLGHGMLSSAPGSTRETQPLVDAIGTLVITADARIDNRAELSSLLGLGTASATAMEDAALILAAYRAWGAACPGRLVGDYAFAIWDGNQQLLFCARDHLGVKPFYYHASRDILVFASDVEAVVRHPQVPCGINEGRIADYLVSQLEGIDKVSTFYQDVRRLPPGHTMSVSPDRADLRAYWTPDVTSELRCGSDEEYAEAFRETFVEAVRSRLRGATPAGVMLSGGLDSSSIAGVARGLTVGNGGRRLHTFSGVSRGTPACSETRHIQAVLDLGGFEAHTLSAEELEELSKGLDEHLETTEDLFDHMFILPQAMYVLARGAGVRALLDGVDGDVVTSQSPDCVAAHLRSGRWRTALSAARRDSAFYRGIYPPWSSTARLLYHGLRTAYVPNALRRMRGGTRQRAEVRRNIRESIIAPDFARRVDLAGRLDLLRSHGRRTPWGTLREEHARSVLSPYITVAVERYDRVSAAYGVEAQHPFLDKRVIERCLSLPWDQKFGRGWPKRIVRNAMSGVLPDGVRWRHGCWEHLGPAFTTAFLGLRRHVMDEVVRGGLGRVSPYVDVAGVRTAYGRYCATGDLDEGVKVWEATALSSWLRRAGRTEATSLGVG